MNKFLLMRVTLSEINKVTDSLLDTGKYNISFGTIPGSGLAETKIVTSKCYSISLPSEEVETIEINTHGHKIHHRGLKKQDKTFSASFYNNGSGWTSFSQAIKIPMDSYRLFKDWIDRVADIENQSSASKSLLSTSLNSYASGATGEILNKGISNGLSKLGINANILNAKTSKKNLYTCAECQVDIYNQANVLQNRFIFHNVFPISIKGSTLGDYKNTLSTEVTFNFDYFTCLGVLETKVLSGVDIAERMVKDKLDFLPF